MKKILAAALLAAVVLPAGVSNADAPKPPQLPSVAVPWDFVDYVAGIPYGVMTQACQSEYWFIPRVCMG